MRGDSREKGDTPIRAELECRECHTRTSVELSSERFKELSSVWKLTEDCGVCGKFTEWSFAEASVEAEEQVDFWDWLATTGEYFESFQAAPQHERRKEARVGLRVPLRIATLEDEEEEVGSENISKSGLCFVSSKTYSVGETLRVTLQPAGALAPQTKTATVVRCSAVQDGEMLYGLRLVT
jgi:hypothetical protein